MVNSTKQKSKHFIKTAMASIFFKHRLLVDCISIHLFTGQTPI